jgi:hypothetical protein
MPTSCDFQICASINRKGRSDSGESTGAFWPFPLPEQPGTSLNESTGLLRGLGPLFRLACGRRANLDGPPKDPISTLAYVPPYMLTHAPYSTTLMVIYLLLEVLKSTEDAEED